MGSAREFTENKLVSLTKANKFTNVSSDRRSITISPDKTSNPNYIIGLKIWRNIDILISKFGYRLYIAD